MTGIVDLEYTIELGRKQTESITTMSSNKGSSGYISVVGTADDNDRPLLNGDQGKRSPRCTPSDKVAKRMEIAILTLVIVLVVALLSLPSVLRFVRKVSTLHGFMLHACHFNAQ